MIATDLPPLFLPPRIHLISSRVCNVPGSPLTQNHENDIKLYALLPLPVVFHLRREDKEECHCLRIYIRLAREDKPELFLPSTKMDDNDISMADGYMDPEFRAAMFPQVPTLVWKSTQDTQCAILGEKLAASGEFLHDLSATNTIKMLICSPSTSG